jgi:hypothetical protein
MGAEERRGKGAEVEPMKAGMKDILRGDRAWRRAGEFLYRLTGRAAIDRCAPEDVMGPLAGGEGSLRAAADGLKTARICRSDRFVEDARAAPRTAQALWAWPPWYGTP